MSDPKSVKIIGSVGARSNCYEQDDGTFMLQIEVVGLLTNEEGQQISNALLKPVMQAVTEAIEAREYGDNVEVAVTVRHPGDVVQ